MGVWIAVLKGYTIFYFLMNHFFLRTSNIYIIKLNMMTLKLKVLYYQLFLPPYRESFKMGWFKEAH